MDHIEISEEYREGLRCLRQIRNAGPEARKRFSHFLQSTAELYRVKHDSVFALGTDDLIVVLEPTERLHELISATRAWETERNAKQAG